MENCASEVGTKSECAKTKKQKQKTKKKVNKVPKSICKMNIFSHPVPSFCDPYPKPSLELNSEICHHGIRSSRPRRQVFLVVGCCCLCSVSAICFLSSMLANPCRPSLRWRRSETFPSQPDLHSDSEHPDVSGCCRFRLVVEGDCGYRRQLET